MNQRLRFWHFLLLAVCVAMTLPGCSARGVKVEGKVLRNGQPFTPPQGTAFNLSLNGTGPAGAAVTYPATISTNDGSFVVEGPKGAGVPPGKYTISANLTPEGTDPASLDKAQKASAALASINGKECEVTGPGRPLTIDIGKGTVTQ